ncbi:dehydrogenase [Maricaulis sp.]|uniref:GHMP family kinase ATP-binding protein n=1 Tax=Maricaulis sp. TaxID=1486257 RepID=UPI003A935C32
MRHKVVRARAPLRLGFGGGGTDVSPYCDDFGGVILNATISKFAHVTIEHRGDGKASFHSADLGEDWEGPAESCLPMDGKAVLLKGVYNRMVRDFNGGRPLSIKVTSYADAPAGSGLGTSSSVVVALTEAFRFWLGAPLGMYELAHLAYEIERNDLALAGGRQDQYAAAFGGINFMEFGAKDHVIINPLRVPQDIVQELESGLVTYFTGASRESANIIDEQSQRMRDNHTVSLDALHSMKRAAYSMKESLLRGDIAGLARTLGESWHEKKKTAASIANPEIDRVYDLALAAGAIGGKVSGAGGGGFMMFLIDPPRREDLMRELRKQGGLASTCIICPHGSSAWRVK